MTPYLSASRSVPATSSRCGNRILSGEESIAHDINGPGQIVGWAGGIYDKYAFLWDNGEMTLLPGDGFSGATAISDSGEVVGYYVPSGTTFHAALWRDGQRYDLNSLIGDTTVLLKLAHDVNDAGQIVAEGMGNGGVNAYLLTPVRSR